MSDGFPSTGHPVHTFSSGTPDLPCLAAPRPTPHTFNTPSPATSPKSTHQHQHLLHHHPINPINNNLTRTAARQDYVHLEGLIASQLSGLVRDAAWLKSYMVSSLLLTKEAMQVRGGVKGVVGEEGQCTGR